MRCCIKLVAACSGMAAPIYLIATYLHCFEHKKSFASACKMAEQYNFHFK